MTKMIGQIIVICLMAIISTSSSPLGDSRSINDKPTHVDEKSPIKKAYTYVSEYKRLPVFNFGIGKRWIGNKGAQPYSFGFGKRSAVDVYPLRLGMNYLPYNKIANYDNYLNDDMSDDSSRSSQLNDKRSGRIRLYDFGLGKRMISRPDTGSYNENLQVTSALRNFMNADPDRRFIYAANNRFAEDQEEDQEDD